MLQFYFLSVILNALAGYILFFDNNGVLELKGELSERGETFKLVIGILSAVTGLFKLLSPIEGDLPVIGDFVPVITGFLCAFILIYEYYRQRATIGDSGYTERAGNILAGNKRIVGAVAFAAAILHFLFPRVLLL